jgi:PAS domain S-box-containing protein
MSLVTDVSELRAAERALRASEERFRALVQHSSDLVLVLEAQGTISYASPSVERVLGYQGNVLGVPLTELIEARSAAWLKKTLEGLGSLDPETPVHAEVLVSRLDGSTRVFELRFTNLLHDPAVAGIVVNGRDVTDGRRFEIELQHQALHDLVTGLPNRVLLSDRLRQAIHRARREGVP